MNSQWQNKHKDVMKSFLLELNKKTDDFTLKGGTALMFCYNLSRFSEDIDLDGKQNNIEEYIKDFCEDKQYSYRIAKNTDTVKRFMVNYGNDSKPLKVEVSYREKNIDNSEYVTKINNINVYSINHLMTLKRNAYLSRDKIRDLYDITYIYSNYKKQLTKENIVELRSALSNKGFEHFDYIVRNQYDDLINNNELANKFIDMFDDLGLLMENEEREPVVEDLVSIVKELSKEERKTKNNEDIRINVEQNKER